MPEIKKLAAELLKLFIYWWIISNNVCLLNWYAARWVIEILRKTNVKQMFWLDGTLRDNFLLRHETMHKQTRGSSIQLTSLCMEILLISFLRN